MSLSKEEALKLIKKSSYQVIRTNTSKPDPTDEEINDIIQEHDWCGNGSVLYCKEDDYSDFDNPLNMWMPYEEDEELLTDDTILPDLENGGETPALLNKNWSGDDDQNYVRPINMSFPVIAFCKSLGRELQELELDTWNDTPGFCKLYSYYYALLVSNGFLKSFMNREYSNSSLLPISVISFEDKSYEAFRSELASKLFDIIGCRLGGVDAENSAVLTKEEKLDIIYFIEKSIDHCSYFCFMSSRGVSIHNFQ